MELSELPLLEGVLDYIKENNISFCMPGHKNGKGFFNTSIGREFLKNITKFDVTEVDGVDNLHDQSGIILEASKKLSELYCSEKSYFLVNGSTSGNMIMIFSSLNEGDKVIVERNCHRSILNALIMRKAVPIYVQNVVDTKINAPGALDLEHFLKTIQANKDAKAVIITYPNYYGICTNLRYVIDISRKYNMKVLVDSAHGAHFGICNELPENAVKLGADMVVMSAHKTLPSFTQTAYLHVNNNCDINKVNFYFNVFISTSPSYLALCSMDYARFYLATYGKDKYKKLICELNYYKNKINTIDGMRVLDKRYIDNLDFAWDIDSTRYVINLDKYYSGHLLLKYLRKNKIQCEMSDSSNVVLIFSPFNNRSEFEKLYQVLNTCKLENLRTDSIKITNYEIPRMKLLPYEVIFRKKEFMDLNYSLGRICGDSVIPYPPGIPIICAGEIIDLNVLETIKYYKHNNIDLIGISKNYIQVISD